MISAGCLWDIHTTVIQESCPVSFVRFRAPWNHGVPNKYILDSLVQRKKPQYHLQDIMSKSLVYPSLYVLVMDTLERAMKANLEVVSIIVRFQEG
jgi:hypothetical protein